MSPKNGSDWRNPSFRKVLPGGPRASGSDSEVGATIQRMTGDAKVCEHCHGRGWVVQTGDRGVGAGSARRCDCKTSRKTALTRADRLESAGVPVRYRQCSLSSFQTSVVPVGAGREQLTEALSLSRQYVKSFLDDSGAFRDTGILFHGPPGRGKTHLATAILGELMENYGVHGKFVDFSHLIEEIQATFHGASEKSKRQVLSAVADAEVLVLDELGAQKPTEFVRETLYLVMNTRYSKRLPTLFTTNYQLEDSIDSENLDRGPGLDYKFSLAHRIGPALASRLYEMARPVNLAAALDYRREFQAHQHRS